MERSITTALSATLLLSVASSASLAQTAPPTYEGDPAVYKVIFEDQNFRVITALGKKVSTTRTTRIRFHQSSILSPTVSFAFICQTAKRETLPTRREGRRRSPLRNRILPKISVRATVNLSSSSANSSLGHCSEAA